MTTEKEKLQKESLKDFLTDMAGAIAKTYEAQGFFSPMWIVQSKGNPIHVFVTPWGNDQEKRASVEFVKNKMTELRAIRHVHIGEVWMLVVPKDEGIPESIRLGARVSSHPKRVEAIMALAEDIYGNYMQIHYPIIRDKDGKGTLGEAEPMDCGTPEGLFTNLLEKVND